MRYRNATTGEVSRYRCVEFAGARRGRRDPGRSDADRGRRGPAPRRGRDPALATIVEQSGDFVGIARVDGTVEYVNEAGRQMVGLADMEAAQRSSIRDYFAR